MSTQITVNGVAVTADKQLRSVTGNRVTFSDGSWVDVGAGELSNVGPGALSIDTEATRVPSASLSEPARTPEDDGDKRSYPARTLIINAEHLRATITTATSDVPRVDVALAGDPGALSVVGVVLRGESLTLFTDRGAAAGQPEVKATIVVAEGTHVMVLGRGPDVLLDSTHGPLTVHAQGQRRVSAGTVRSLSLSLQGQASARVAAVTEGSVVDVQDQGVLHVGRAGSRGRQAGGESSLSLQARGEAQVRWLDPLARVRVEARDESQVVLRQVQEAPEVEGTDPARLVVEGWSAEHWVAAVT